MIFYWFINQVKVTLRTEGQALKIMVLYVLKSYKNSLFIHIVSLLFFMNIIKQNSNQRDNVLLSKSPSITRIKTPLNSASVCSQTHIFKDALVWVNFTNVVLCFFLGSLVESIFVCFFLLRIYNPLTIMIDIYYLLNLFKSILKCLTASCGFQFPYISLAPPSWRMAWVSNTWTFHNLNRPGPNIMLL